jgi:SnoaL-like domain
MDNRPGNQCRWRQRMGQLGYKKAMNKHAAFLIVMAAFAWSMPQSLTYPQSPAQSASSSNNACSPPREYVKLINDGRYDALGNLFAEKAVYMGPDGKTRYGSKDIGAFYSTFLPKLKPQFRAARFFEHDNECMMELENKSSRTGEYAPTAVDHFTVDSAGKISRFVVYLRPGAESTRRLMRALSAR